MADIKSILNQKKDSVQNTFKKTTFLDQIDQIDDINDEEKIIQNQDNQKKQVKNDKNDKNKDSEYIKQQKLLQEQLALERQRQIDERNNEARNQLNQVDSEYFKNQFEQNGVEISKLSKTKYQFILDEYTNTNNSDSSYIYGKQDKQIKKSLIMALPELGDKINQRKEIPFISFDNAKYINQNIISTIEEEQEQSILSSHQQKGSQMVKSNKNHYNFSYQQTPDCQSLLNSKKNRNLQKEQINQSYSISKKHSVSHQNLDKKLFSGYQSSQKRNNNGQSMLQSNNSQSILQSESHLFSDKNYTQKDKIAFELVHNKSAKNTLNKIDLYQNNKIFGDAEQNILKIQEKILKQPRIRVFDSKNYQKMQKVIKQKKQYEMDQKDKDASKFEIQHTSAQKFFNLNEKKSPRMEKMEISDKNEQKFQKIVQFEDNNNSVKRQLQDLVHQNQQNNLYQAFNMGFSQSHWRPLGRENCAFAVIDKKAYLYGGSSIRNTNEICYQNVNSLKWEVVRQTKGEIPKNYRYSHQMVAYKKNLYILGGYQNNIDTSDNNIGECIMDVKTFNTETLTWKSIHLFGELIQPRKNFSCTIHGKTIIVHGGIDNWGNFLNDTWLFDIPTSRWSQAITNTPQSKAYQNGIGYHSCCNVYNQERKMLVVYKQLEKIDGRFSGIQQEGVYFFGGKKQISEMRVAELKQIMIDGKDDGDRNEVVGELQILKIDTKPFQWIQPETKGERPSPRFSCAMVYNPQTENIFVYGGQNDNMIQMVFLNDLYVLKLSNLEWLKVNLYNGQNLPGRTGHSSYIVDSKMYIFGGINFNGFCSSETVVIELDEKEAYLNIKKELQNQALKQLEMQIQENQEMENEKRNSKVRDPNKETQKKQIVPEINNQSSLNSPTNQRKNNIILKGHINQSSQQSSPKRQKLDLNSEKLKRLMYDNSVTYNPQPVQQSIAELRSNRQHNRPQNQVEPTKNQKKEKSLINIIGSYVQEKNQNSLQQQQDQNLNLKEDVQGKNNNKSMFSKIQYRNASTGNIYNLKNVQKQQKDSEINNQEQNQLKLPQIRSNFSQNIVSR
ncbi:Galactose oxidase/kelch, beta-propeller [Pseudocohnilembus persalinus]|uniref:Galactose oxidase/kelch, beta-propeller n=1 Tax=Pseudocohnilembus persalinus TaxID=266149 RepID=A0A0V0R784_PSEPJ|nr:Galactose oxidase/kelch, beta-propeller [Pseudocohnilembus persalinus]|eukprot:KRX10374.1 Galactose oxidase/kelch, beta-propeller [Pseudocohnilembus persalinus]